MTNQKQVTKVDPKFLPEVNIGMVGHVDHGKTTLTQALTGKWTDTHSEEIRRGITIRLGYADVTLYKADGVQEPECYSLTPEREDKKPAKPARTISLVDAPGHETLMTTMLSGASIMNGAILLIAANEPCPQPQTREHMTALNLVGIKNIIVVQSKIDLVSEEEAQKNYQQIKEFLKGTVAENAPIIPISAQHNINIDALLAAIQEIIPTPEYDMKKNPLFYISRTFDINKPGTPIKKLGGGVVGGSLVQGKLKVGEEIEIRPGLKIKDSFEPVTTTITGLQKSGKDLPEVTPGGLLGLSTNLDPYVTKSDTLAGNILGIKGSLPPVWDEITVKPHFFDKVVGAKEEVKMEQIKHGDPLMLTVCVSRTVGVAIQPSKDKITMKLKIPVCANRGEKVAISKQVGGRWRLIGWGEIV